MKKTVLFILTFSIILNIFNLVYGAENKSLRAKFKESDIAGTNFKEITITPYDYDDDDDEDEEKTYYIYLPSGYFVEGTSASYVADRNGKYPFTIYDGRYKNTFIHKVDDIDDDIPSKDKKENKDKIDFSYELKYDYEKKQVLFNMKLDKLSNVTTPGSRTITNEVNYFIKSLENNIPFDFTIIIDEESFNYKLIKQGEYYLLIYISPVNYNDYSTIVEYNGYNFTNNKKYTTYPSKDIYDDNGKYEVLVKSDASQQIFNFNISGIDYRRPSVDIEFLDDDTFNLEFEDDFELDYIITFDGKYVDINNTESYNHPTQIRYRGDYIFTVVDEKGNRTVEYAAIVNKQKRKPTKHAIDLAVHDESKITDYLFENIGLEYKKQDDDTKYFENILPAYMNGKSPENFNPDSPISRAEIVTIFCRLNNLPYDTNAYLKTKFTDIDNHWARDYISMGSSKKYVSGYKDKTFKPDNNVTRAEFCQMLTKISAYKSLLNAIPASSNYTYSDISSHWAEKEIIKISSRDLVVSSGNYFYPDKPITRGEVVHAINKLYGYNPSYIELGHINSLYNKHYNFEDIRQHKFYNDIIISVVGMYREIIE